MTVCNRCSKEEEFYYDDPAWKTHQKLWRIRNTIMNRYLDMKKHDLYPPLLVLKRLKVKPNL